MSDSIDPTRRAKRLLSAEQKYEIWLKILCGELTTNEAAAHAGVDRSTVLKLRKVAKDGAIAALRRRGRDAATAPPTASWCSCAPRTPGCRPRSSSRRSSWRRCGEKRPGVERPGPASGFWRGEGRAVGHHRGVCGLRVVDPAGLFSASGGPAPRLALAAPPHPRRLPQRLRGPGGPLPGRQADPWPAGLGDRRRAGPGRAVGAHRPPAPQAGPPGLISQRGVGVALHGAPSARKSRRQPAQGAAAA